WQAQHQIPECHAKNKWRYQATDSEPPVPQITPAWIVDFGAVVKAYRPEKQRAQRDDQRHIEPGKGRRVHHWPGGEYGASSGNEPHLVAFPVRPYGIDHHTAIHVGSADNSQ